jgi:hypothetical protein
MSPTSYQTAPPRIRSIARCQHGAKCFFGHCRGKMRSSGSSNGESSGWNSADWPDDQTGYVGVKRKGSRSFEGLDEVEGQHAAGRLGISERWVRELVIREDGRLVLLTAHDASRHGQKQIQAAVDVKQRNNLVATAPLVARVLGVDVPGIDQRVVLIKQHGSLIVFVVGSGQTRGTSHEQASESNGFSERR